MGQGSQICLILRITRYLNAERGAPYLKRFFSLSGGTAQAPSCFTNIAGDKQPGSLKDTALGDAVSIRQEVLSDLCFYQFLFFDSEMVLCSYFIDG